MSWGGGGGRRKGKACPGGGKRRKGKACPGGGEETGFGVADRQQMERRTWRRFECIPGFQATAQVDLN